MADGLVTNMVDEVSSPLVIDHADRISENAPAPSSDVSELEQHKRDRGYAKPPMPSQAAAPGPPESEAAGPDAATPSIEEPNGPDEKKRQEQFFIDPDTGEKLDRRHRYGRRMQALLKDRFESREQTSRERTEKEFWKRRTEELEAKRSQPEQPKQAEAQGDPEPDPADTTKYPEGQFDKAFMRDMGRWAARQETAQFAQTTRAEQTQQRQQAAEIQQVSTWQGTLPDARKKYADFDEVLAKIPNTPENAPIVRLMMGSPVGNDVVYVLGTQPDTMKIYQQANPEQKMRLLYHIEAQLIQAHRGATPKQPSTTRAPQPTTPVNTSGGAAQGVDWARTDDPDQYARYKAMRGNRR